MDAALSMLGRRSYSQRALERRLLERFPPAATAACLARLVELGMLDDDALAERLVRERFERRGYGRLRVLAALVEAGVDPSVAERQVTRLIEPEAERRKAAEQLAVFLESHRNRTGATAAAYRHLERRGFPTDLVRDLLRNCL
jgi:SOS response regulatory protein OraA/RecX